MARWHNRDQKRFFHVLIEYPNRRPLYYTDSGCTRAWQMAQRLTKEQSIAACKKMRKAHRKAKVRWCEALDERWEVHHAGNRWL